MPEHICENAAERHEWRAAVWNSIAIASRDAVQQGARHLSEMAAEVATRMLPEPKKLKNHSRPLCFDVRAFPVGITLTLPGGPGQTSSERRSRARDRR